MTDGPRPRSGGSQRGPQPDPSRRPAPGVTELREGHRSGYGSPEAVVPAGAGTVYRDTDPAGSGKVYKKTTPSGNTGWVELGAGGGGGGLHHGVMVVEASADIITIAAGSPPKVLTASGGATIDVEGLYAGSTGIYTAPENGWYLFDLILKTTGSGGADTLGVTFDLNGPGAVLNQSASNPAVNKRFGGMVPLLAGPNSVLVGNLTGGSITAHIVYFSAIMIGSDGVVF